MRVIFKKQFEKRFKKLSPKLKEQFYERLELLLRDKFNRTLNNHSVGFAYPDCRSINITGDCRAIFQETEDAIVFVLVGTHPELY